MVTLTLLLVFNIFTYIRAINNEHPKKNLWLIAGLEILIHEAGHFIPAFIFSLNPKLYLLFKEDSIAHIKYRLYQSTLTHKFINILVGYGSIIQMLFLLTLYNIQIYSTAVYIKNKEYLSTFLLFAITVLVALRIVHAVTPIMKDIETSVPLKDKGTT